MSPIWLSTCYSNKHQSRQDFLQGGAHCIMTRFCNDYYWTCFLLAVQLKSLIYPYTNTRVKLKGKVFSVSTTKTNSGSSSIAALILIFGIRCRWVVNLWGGFCWYWAQQPLLTSPVGAAVYGGAVAWSCSLATANFDALAGDYIYIYIYACVCACVRAYLKI